MALITRVARLFRADLHAVLDRIEEPEVLLRQAVREMEEELVRDQQRLKVLTQEHRQLSARETELDQSLSEIDTELDICFAAGKDDLARALIKRKLEAQRRCQALARKREVLEETLGGLKTRIEENRTRFDSMRQKAELLAEDEAPSHRKDSCWTPPATSVRDEDVEVALLREKQKRSRP